jgi:hypothetical protein
VIEDGVLSNFIRAEYIPYPYMAFERISPPFSVRAGSHIVSFVGNRGLGVADGQLLGSVPGEVAKNAACNVLIVQTSDVDGDPVSVQAGQSDGDHPVT